MKTHIETIAAFVAEQMNGAEVPLHESPEWNRINEAQDAIVKAIRDPQQDVGRDLQVLASRILIAASDRISAGLSAERTLLKLRIGSRHV